MRKTLVLTGVLLTVCAASSWALKNNVALQGGEEWQSLLQYDLLGEPGGPIASHSDTVYFGGSGTGNGTIVRGGIWDWEADSGEAPQQFPDGDPVGNQFNDGWEFEDRTTRNGPSATGAGHWSATGVYNFSNDNGAYAHRATTHPNNGSNDGPGPLVGSWSIWVGTNLFLNPEHCGWGQSRGYGDGWSAGIQKSFAIPAGDQNVPYSIEFFHRYAVEDGFDTNWVEASFDGQNFFFVDVTDIYNGGDAANPQPGAGGGTTTANLGLIPFNTAGTIHVRFRLSSDAFFSDNNEGGNFLYGWQLDSIQLKKSGNVNVGALSTFEAGLDGWELRRHPGFDFQQTGSLQPVGRIVDIGDLACPPAAICPGGCLGGNILMFADANDCDVNDSFQDSYLVSPGFAIGGPTNPDLDGDAGRLFEASVYVDGGAANAFDTGPSICYDFWPFNTNKCAPSGYTPPAGNPGAGVTFNWSQTDFGRCSFFQQGAGAACVDAFRNNISAEVPAAADSIIIHVGAFSQCRSNPACDTQDNGAPFYDDVRFGIFNPAGVVVTAATIDRYSDNFPTAEGSFLTSTVRTDGAHSFSQNLNDIPYRWVRADTAVANTGAPNVSVHLRWRFTPGPCQPNPGHAFFTAFPANVWHSARMDTARAQGTGNNAPARYMTCFHEADARNGTFWTGAPPAVEPCDDILPDGLFTAGSKVDYFFEVRNATNNTLLGTFPSARNGRAIGTGNEWFRFWLEMTNLPAMDPSCNGSQLNNFLVINDSDSAVIRGRLTDVLGSLGLDFDVYDSVGAAFNSSYNGIGRREDLVGQQPRRPYNGATDQQIEGYDCIWYTSGLFESETLSDETTDNDPPNTGHPSNDQQRLETWIDGCSGAAPTRLLVLEGHDWASNINSVTDNGPDFLDNRGVGVLTNDYAQDLANNDQRRCARIVGQGVGAGLSGEIFGPGCPEDLNLQVLTAGNGGVAVMNFVESNELAADDVDCTDDDNQPTWHAVIRRQDAGEACERSASMAFSFSHLLPLNCADECIFDDFIVTGDNAELVIDIFQWANKPINANPVGVGEPEGAPRLVNALYQAEPNPANPSAKIRYTIAEKGRVSLRIFDVSGRLVRTLVDEVKDATAEGYEAVWDGTNDGGQRVGSGVFFYQIDTPTFMSAKKLVILK
jgi:hypothetical protein